MSTPTNAALAAVFLIALASTASAQLTTETHFQAASPEDELDWRDGSVDRSIGVQLCYEMGGVNLLGGSFIVEITVSIPTWANATHPQSIAVTPPAGPTDAAGCTTAVPFTLELQALDGIPANETFQVQIQLSAEPEQDENGQPTTGNYETPSDHTVSYNVTAVTEPDPIVEDDPPEENGSPGPAIGILLVAAIAALAIIRRRA